MVVGVIRKPRKRPLESIVRVTREGRYGAGDL